MVRLEGSLKRSCRQAQGRAQPEAQTVWADLPARPSHRAVTNVLPPEAHHVAAAQAGTDQKGERQPGLRTGRMPCLEGGNVFLSPGVESARVLSARRFVAGCRVGIDYAPRDSKGHQATQRLEHISLR